jgi:hypothetical protein
MTMAMTPEGLRALGASEHEIKRAFCEHDFGETWERSWLGCTQTCQKCGAMVGHPNHCGQADARRERA